MIKNVQIKGLITLFFLVWAILSIAQQNPAPSARGGSASGGKSPKGDLDAQIISPASRRGLGCRQSNPLAESQMLRSVPPGLASSQSRSDTIDILEFEINLDITDFISQMIRGNCKITFTSKMDGINTINLDLLKLIIDSVTSGTDLLTFNYNDTLLEVNFASTFNLGDTGEVTVYYRGSPQMDPSGWGGFYFQGNYAFNLGVGFDSDPHNYGRVWFPCFDNFVERAAFTFNITTAGGRIAVCNGALIGETTLAGDTVMRTWRLDQEIPSYLACVAVSDYEAVKMTHAGIEGAVPIELYANAGDTTNLKASFTNLGGAIAAYENSYGAYRWNKVGYSLVPFNNGAMEHATNIAYPRFSVDGSIFYQDLMAHELSHQWWGNLATCETEGDMWLNEGMATYSEFRFNEMLYGAKTYLQMVKDNHEYVMHLVHINEGGYLALYGIPHQYTYGDHVYLKGADVAHTLRAYLGDSLFFAGLTAFLQQNSFSYMNSYMLRDFMQQFTGIDLSDFFDKWVFKPGFPHFSIDSVVVSPNGPNYDATVYVKQKLTGASSFFNGVPMEITFMDAGWNSQTKPMAVSGAVSSATFNLPFNPVYTAINYNHKISDAISSDVKVLSAPGAYNFVNNQAAHLTITLNSITDSALIRVEHNWAAPDPMTGPSIYRLCPNRYWKVDGILPANYSMSADMFYDGRKSGSSYYDSGLFDMPSSKEDSLVLLYRKNAGKVWSEYPYYTKNMIALNDRWGQIIIDSLILGEYVFAIKGTLFANSAAITNTMHVSCNGMCDGSATATGAGGISPYTYLWSSPGTQTTSTATGLCAGAYAVTVSDAGGDTVVLIATVVESDSLSGVVAAQNESCSGCSDGKITISAMGGATPYTYQWNDPGSQTTFIATGLSPGLSYSVTVYDANGCSYTAANISIGIGEAPLLRGAVRVFPNPATDAFVLEFNTETPETGMKVLVTDINGKKIFKKPLEKKQCVFTINTSNWNQGIYLIQLYTAKQKIYSGKIVVAH